MSHERDLTTTIYRYLAEDEDVRVCKDIPEEACSHQPKSFVFHLWALTLTKLGDSLVSARLVLPWLLSASGAPVFFISLLVPLRESLSLLPQLFVAQWMRERPVRKWFWVVGSVGEGAALLAMALGLFIFDGTALGWWVIGWLCLFSLCRGVCSVALKDVMGKTVSKSRRGRLTGLAASAAGLMTLLTALVIIFTPDMDGSNALFVALLSGAALLWFISAVVYAVIPETPGATAGGGNAIREAVKSLRILWQDRQFGHFVATRALLISTAFSIPYIVVLIQSQTEDSTLTGLGGLLLANGLAGMLAGRFWGKWSDSASHHVMSAAALLAVLVMLAAVVVDSLWQQTLAWLPVGGGLIFFAAVAHHGARVGRKTYLIDMATQENRAQLTAVSNTVIGVLLLLGAVLGVVDTLFGTQAVLWLLIAVGSVAAWRALRLPNVADS